jgi:transcription elongation factor Elf1
MTFANGSKQVTCRSKVFFECPACGLMNRLALQQHKDLGWVVKLSVKCGNCGRSYNVGHVVTAVPSQPGA